jgi:hypothetical protein
MVRGECCKTRTRREIVVRLKGVAQIKTSDDMGIVSETGVNEGLT